MAPRGKKKARAGYMISAVATLYKIHPQTLRLYERVGLLKPSRSQGNTRLYTDSDLERLDVILNYRAIRGVARTIEVRGIFSRVYDAATRDNSSCTTSANSPI